MFYTDGWCDNSNNRKLSIFLVKNKSLGSRFIHLLLNNRRGYITKIGPASNAQKLAGFLQGTERNQPPKPE